ncbi:MAG TPA: phage holin family protein [Gammaproteobacteria bacterium]|nr:phage holin family protein [Gammaproteobacteria bacterium]
MKALVTHVIVSAVVCALLLLLVDHFLDGLAIAGFGHALFAAALLGVVNTFVRPVLLLITLPITIVTLGLFLFVLNALMLLLVAAVAPGFTIDGFGTALLAALLLAVLNLVVNALLNPRRADGSR